MTAPTFKWFGSQNADIKSGRAEFTFADDKQELSLDLPDFGTALAISQFINSVYAGGKLVGAKRVQSAVEHAMGRIMEQ